MLREPRGSKLLAETDEESEQRIWELESQIDMVRALVEDYGLRSHLARARRFEEMIRSGEAANAAEVSRMEGLTRARVSQLRGLLRLDPAILDDLEAQDGAGPVPTEGALRKLSMLPLGKQMIRYRQLVKAEEKVGRPR